MTNLVIEKFIDTPSRRNKVVHIHFKSRNCIDGVFLFGNDYEELKNKNFWRIVAEANNEEWLRTGDLGCSRLFKGDAFSRLSDS